LSVQMSPSLQGVSLSFLGLLQVPLFESQTPGSWHWSVALHWTGLLPVQLPPWHVSVCVHSFPSSHCAPLPFGVFGHWPVPGSHTRVWWHWSAAGHTTGLLPVHTPCALQVSVCVQSLPSSQPAPVLGGFEHMPFSGLQTPTPWH